MSWPKGKPSSLYKIIVTLSVRNEDVPHAVRAAESALDQLPFGLNGVLGYDIVQVKEVEADVPGD